MVDRDTLIKLYWEDRLTFRQISSTVHYSPTNLSKLFRGLDIPTTKSVISRFSYFLESLDDFMFFFREYLNWVNPYQLEGNYVIWRARSLVQKSIEKMKEYIERKSSTELRVYQNNGRHTLICSGIFDCLDLAACFQLDWLQELYEINGNRRLVPGEGLELLELVMRNNGWYTLSQIRERLEWYPERAMYQVRRAIEKDKIERTGKRGSYRYRWVTEPIKVPMSPQRLAILEILKSSSEPLTSAEIIRKSGVKTDTVYRALKSLVNYGSIDRFKGRKNGGRRRYLYSLP